MPKITIDGKLIECRDGIPVLQAALQAGWDIPHYCYHPGLSIVASCRLCLMEMKMPDPKTKELAWSPRLLPSCQTPVRDGMEVRFDSDKIRDNQRQCMEYFLLNHPLDCPVCDQAGECYLQDYSYKFGSAASRMVEAKLKNPKKDIGSKTLLYQDRCVMCSRCVRFCNEVAGTSELCIVNRGSRAEIDVFPGLPLENALQGNVVDVCPVGSLLDKDFLMKKRVWMLRETDSICPLCATGCAIELHSDDDQLHRLKPRYNPGVNDWWMCDEGRFGWKYVHDSRRITQLAVRRGAELERPDWRDLPTIVKLRLGESLHAEPGARLAAVLSPFMSCEEAWLLTRFIRSLHADAALVLGPVPHVGEDQKFPLGRTNGQPARFTILAEKCPNRLGIEMILADAGGNTLPWNDFLARAKKDEFAAAWIVGGYPHAWVTKDLEAALPHIRCVVAQDLLPSALSNAAAVVLPACAWAEREGCFVNQAGRIQSFDAGLNPPEGAQRDGQYLYSVAGYEGLYRASRVRELMSGRMPQFAALHVPPPVPVHAH
ncbi:MAG: 2Fe-2S iron-sulfur cluster-binding protein [Phycisphaerae bacterium]|nr:2Fe-2S iron-sulfur cluster-binding protein [Phycisphaerae bacterium]